MEKDRMMDVDIETFSEINRDQEEMEKSLSLFVPKEKDPNWFSNYYKNPNGLKPNKKENYMPPSNSLSGIKNINGKSDEQPGNSSKGFTGWVKENPITATVTGLALAAGAFALFRHLKKDDQGISMMRRKPKRKSILVIEKDGSENTKESTRKEEIHKEDYKVTQEAIIVAGASALGGTIAGAALGDISLLASVPLAIMGFNKRNLNVAMASIGMALTNGYQSLNYNGNFIQRAIERIKTFVRNLFHKIFLLEEYGERKGYIKTLLGYIPINQVALRR